jgi:phosphate uptake regulator
MDVGISEASFFLSASKTIERIADHAERIAQNVQSIPLERVSERVIDEIKSYGTKVLSVFDMSIEALLKRDLSAANKVVEESERLRDSGEELTSHIMEQKGKSVVPLALVMESSRRTALYSADIVEIATNLEGVH